MTHCPSSASDTANRPFLASRPRQMLIGVAIFAGMVLWLLMMGRPFVCPCGRVSLWQGMPTAEENSQAFADWYSLLHGVFGMGLFLFTHWMKPRWRIGETLLTGLVGSVLWEAMENTPFLIALFSASPNAPPYFGDSILNATGDTLFVLAGFWAAARLPSTATIALAIGAEIAVTAAVHDGFVLGTLRLAGVDV